MNQPARFLNKLKVKSTDDFDFFESPMCTYEEVKKEDRKPKHKFFEL